ncbi:Arc family DNA-binding protein [Jejubacter calystegiae]|uniref:Arc family DNA-binding protein n=1 Tax=Jejubacter calystegiae TaxID=2579935 RepID=A0A4P8YP55_9ENTR|nr:Arc family DNA-binding protein [Jejubacter calystegiae]QCT21748.1 Arc family DNA-binding protein [Jejubacter calystegiae]
MKGARNIAPFGLRMPDEIREAVQQRAKNNGRSMNAEIVKILQDALEGDELPPSYHSDAPTEVNESQMEFYSQPREEQLKQLEKIDPLQAAIERISDNYSKKMMDDVKKAIQEFNKKPT